VDEEEPPKKKKSNPDAWMLSFGDLVSLMLVFFVMLFAMSTIEEEDFEAVISSLSQRFTPITTVDRPVPQIDADIPKVTEPKGYNLDYLRAVISEKVSYDPLLADVIFHQLDDRLVVSLPSQTLFEAGSAALTEEARSAVFLLGDVLRFIRNRVDVAGHTDPAPISSSAFPSNWELSLSRAIAVANELRRAGYTRDIIAFGYADSRYADLSVKLSAPQRHEFARRVDIVIRQSTTEEEFRAP